jgi:hypothetical protein
MKFLQKMFGGSSLPAKIESDNNPKLVVLKGKVHFEIYEDGNGKFRAQHKSGDWLSSEDNLTMFYELSETFYRIEDCQQMAMKYVKGRQLKKVGTIEFIPNKD